MVCGVVVFLIAFIGSAVYKWSVRFAAFVTFLAFCLLSPVFPALPAQTIGTIEYDIQAALMSDESIRSLIGLNEGDVFHPETIEGRLDLLRKTGLFSKITFSLGPAQRQKVKLLITIHEAKTVANIHVHGAYPFLDKEIRKLVAVQPGSPLQMDLLPASEVQIADFLEKNGFYASHVSIHVKPHHHPHKVNLLVKIAKGKRYRVGLVNISGVNNLRLERVRNKVSRSARFRISRLRKNLKSIRRLYARQGYIKSRVNITSLDFDDQRRTVDVNLEVKENRRLKLHFMGNKKFSASRLRQALGFHETRAYDRFAIEESVVILEEFYKNSGYPEATMIMHVDKSRDDTVDVTYDIHAGPRVELTRIRFSGNDHVSGKKLKKQMNSIESGLLRRSVFHPEHLVLDRRKIESYYHEAGYLDATVDLPEFVSNRQGDHREAIYRVAEGKSYRIGSIQFDADQSVRTTTLRRKSSLKIGRELRAKDIDEAATRILDELHRLGYAYATVDIETRVDGGQPGKADVIIHIKRGEKARFGKVIVSGNFITREAVVHKHLKIKPGTPFVYSQLLDGQQRLRKLGIFSAVSIQPLGFESKQDIVDILVSLNERKTVTMEFEAGYDTINLASGEMNFSKRNLFGRAKQLNFRAIGGLRFDRVETTFISPRLFGASWNLSNQYFAQYEDNRNFNAVSLGGSLSMLKNYGPYWTVGFREQLTRTYILEGSSNQQLGSALFDNTLSELQATLSFDIRDNYSDPQKGINTYLKNELSVDIANPDNMFYTLEANLAHYQGFLKRFTLVNTLRYGHVFKLRDAATVPANKLFFMGGDDTLRGFEQDAIDDTGGRISIIYNAELHLRLFDSFKVAGFFDAGSLTDSFRQVQWDNFRESAGVGIRYFTPVGPIRLDLGFILDRQTNEPKRRLHFSFGYFF